MFENKINQSKLRQGQIIGLRGLLSACRQRVDSPSLARGGWSLEILTVEVRSAEHGTVGFSSASPVLSHLSGFHFLGKCL